MRNACGSCAPSPRSCGEKVGMRGAACSEFASLELVERAPHPDPLPAKSGERERDGRAKFPP